MSIGENTGGDCPNGRQREGKRGVSRDDAWPIGIGGGLDEKAALWN